MRKVMLLAAMLAMALAATAPAFGQGFVNQEANQFGVVDDSVCSQVYNIAVQQTLTRLLTRVLGRLGLLQLQRLLTPTLRT